MKLKCSCGTLNEDGSQTCANVDCSASLRFAELVEEPTAPLEAASDSGPTADAVRTTGESCVCGYPKPDPITGICDGCDAPVTASATVQPTPAHSLENASAPCNPTVPVFARLVLPDGNTLDVYGGVTVGRNAPDTSEALARFAGVSRTHCWVAQEGDALLVVDLGSLNGTWIGNERLSRNALCRYALTTLPIYIRLGRKAQLEIIGERLA